MAPNDDHEPLEASSVETAVDVAHKEMGDLKRELKKFLKIKGLPKKNEVAAWTCSGTFAPRFPEP